MLNAARALGQLDRFVEINGQTIPAGTAYLTQRGRALSTASAYEPSYLAHKDAYRQTTAVPAA